MGAAYTILGRRRRLPDIWSTNDMDRWAAERQATNTVIQGSAADTCKLAMLLIFDERLDKKYGCDMLFQVHDEILFECPDEYVEEVKPLIKEWMEHPFPADLAVPLEVDIGHGTSWGTAK
jgi:DNA polymerase-1